MKNRIVPILLKFVDIIFIGISVTLIAITVTYNTFVSMDGRELPNVSLNPAWLLAISILDLAGLLYLQKPLKNIPSRYVFGLCLVIFMVCGLYLVVNVDLYLRKTDAWACLNAARNLNNHVYTDFQSNFNDLTYKSGYLNSYPYQLYWVSFLRILLQINSSLRFLYLLNMVFSVVTFFTVYKLTSAITEDNNVRSNSVILTMLFAPLLFNVLFMYSNVIALMLFMISVLLLVKGIQQGKNMWLLTVSVLVMVAASLLKNNYMIGLVALLITIGTLKLSVKGKLWLICLAIGLIPFSNYVLGSFYTYEAGVKTNLSSGMPKSAFVAMGLHDHQLKNGWYDGSTVKLYQQSGYSSKKADAIAKKDLDRRGRYLIRHPKYTGEFFKEKLVTTWSDPTFQSLWNAPLPTWGGKLKTSVMQSIYDPQGKGKIGKLVRKVSQTVIWFILVFASYMAFQLIRNDEKDRLQTLTVVSTLMFLYFIGGFTFHLFWETKAQYVYQYVLVLIPIASIGIGHFAGKARIMIGKSSIRS